MGAALAALTITTVGNPIALSVEPNNQLLEIPNSPSNSNPPADVNSHRYLELRQTWVCGLITASTGALEPFLRPQSDSV